MAANTRTHIHTRTPAARPACSAHTAGHARPALNGTCDSCLLAPQKQGWDWRTPASAPVT
eukprot:1145401-Pelagomonas_calceolata.AAC.13